MGEALALAAAVMFGSSHFLNGLLARRSTGLSLAVYSQLGGAVLFAVWLLAGPAGSVGQLTLADTGWAVVSGIGAGIGLAALYEGMRRGNISIVIPVTSIVSVAVPFLLSITVLGEPLAAVLLLPVIWLLSQPGARTHADSSGGRAAVLAPMKPGSSLGAQLGLIAGLGFAAQLFALSRLATENPAGALLTGQLVSLLILFPLARTRHVRLAATATASQAAAVGIMAALALTLYLYATRHTLLGPVMIAVALYPALPVLLALVFLKERLTPSQTIGLTTAAIIVPIVTLSA